MRSSTIFLLAVALTTASIAGIPRICADCPTPATAAELSDDSAACTARYNALLGQAKTSLIRGDRNAAVNSLIAANSQLRRCQELEERNSTVPVAVAVNNRVLPAPNSSSHYHT